MKRAPRAVPALLALAFVPCACFGLFSELDDPADPKSSSYQGYDVVSEPDSAGAAGAGGGPACAFVPALVALEVAGADLYHFQVYEVADFTSLVHENPEAGSSRYLPAGWDSPRAETPYYWRVKARKGGSWGEWSASFGTFGLARPSLGAAAPAEGAALAEARPGFDWADIPGAATYRIQPSTRADFSAMVAEEAGLVASSYLPPAPLAGATSYYWRVAARSADGAWGPPSAASRFTTAFPAAAVPTFEPDGGTYSTDQLVAIACATPGAAIYYTTDGTRPTLGSTRCAEEIPVVGNATVTIRAIAISGLASVSALAKQTYTVTYPPAAQPALSPVGGPYAVAPTVTISCPTAGAAIYYSDDGTAPTEASLRYEGPISVPIENATTIRAIAIIAGSSASPEATGTYRCYAVGDSGPAGGAVFYDKGSYSEGWRFLEATTSALGGASNGLVRWCPTGFNLLVGASGTAVGAGAANTAAIIDACGEGDYAAKRCADYSLGGCDDWFLPSKDELDLMYRNLQAINPGGLMSRRYWSSTEQTYGYSWCQDFPAGGQQYSLTHHAWLHVRAARRF